MNSVVSFMAIFISVLSICINVIVLSRLHQVRKQLDKLHTVYVDEYDSRLCAIEKDYFSLDLRTNSIATNVESVIARLKHIVGILKG
jgi:uncharacterized protein YciW